MLGHEAHKQDLVSGVINVVGQMVEDTPRLAHAVCADNDHGAFQIIECLGFFHAGDEPQLVKTERILVVFQERFVGFLIVAFRVNPENARRAHGHGRINVDGYLRNFLLIGQTMEIIDEFLGTFHREGRDDDFPVGFRSFPYDLREFFHRVVRGFMKAVAVGAFKNHVVHGRQNRRIADYRFSLAAEVAGVGDANRVIVRVGYGKDRHGGTENMPGVKKFELDAFCDPDRPVVRDGDELI